MNGTIEQLRYGGQSSETLDRRTDEELLLGYRFRGDSRAFDALVHRYEGELFGYLRHYLGNTEMAEDVFQQTFLQVHLKCEQFEPGRRVRPWLYTVATHQAIDYQRRNRRHRLPSLDRRAYDADDNAGSMIALLDNPHPGPFQQAELTEEHAQVRRAVDGLPEQTKQVVLLVYFQGLKYREAAEILSIPVGTVKSRLHTAIQRLSETLNRVHLPK